jgi:hypothetical protein
MIVVVMIVIVVMIVVIPVVIPIVVMVPAVIVFQAAAIAVPVTGIKLLPVVARFDPARAFIGRARPVAFMPAVMMA